MGTPVHCCAGGASLLGASWPPKPKEKLCLLGSYAFEVTVMAGGLSLEKGRSFSPNTPYALRLMAVPSGDAVCSSV